MIHIAMPEITGSEADRKQQEKVSKFKIHYSNNDTYIVASFEMLAHLISPQVLQR